MKRTFDIITSSMALIILSPVLILTAIAIRLDSKGPILFTQQRIGHLGQLFSIYKFRSMVENSEDIGPYYTSNNDQRITNVGSFIRRTSLDELPQLLNVLKGEMSIVGPRPNVPVQREGYSEKEWDKRNSVKPGITGLHQATLRSAANEEQRLALDLEYVDRSSLFFDFKIILLTIKQVLFKGGN
ncbi:MAG: sugar transferase [Flavobacteriaceae bacterium]|nr:sugar transferase [Flavobacteriaceae bacterium]